MIRSILYALAVVLAHRPYRPGAGAPPPCVTARDIAATHTEQTARAAWLARRARVLDAERAELARVRWDLALETAALEPVRQQQYRLHLDLADWARRLHARERCLAEAYAQAPAQTRADAQHAYEVWLAGQIRATAAHTVTEATPVCTAAADAVARRMPGTAEYPLVRELVPA